MSIFVLIPSVTICSMVVWTKKKEGRRKDFYRLPREDALIMTKRFSYEDSGN